MKNETNVKIPKKYHEGIEKVYKDIDGYWAYCKDGFIFENTECQTAHGENQKEFMDDIRSLKKIN